MSPFCYTIELCPPIDPAHIEAYFKKFKHLLKYTRSFSISSHATPDGLVSGFYRSYNLAHYLQKQHPDVQILYHLTCHDLNRANIHARLLSLKNLGIKRILVVTGEGYDATLDKASNPDIMYRNSSELLHTIAEQEYRHWFDSVAIGGYPNPDSTSISLECDRLVKKALNGLASDAIYTQCLFSATELIPFFKALKVKLPQTKLVPSVALFEGMRSLQRSSRLTKVNPSQTLLFYLDALDEEDSPRFCQHYLEVICRKLAADLTDGDAPLEINICSFGLFEFAFRLIESLEKEDKNHI